MLVFVSDIMLHSRAPRMIPLPKFGSCSSDFGAFMFIRSKCGCNMYAKMLSGFLITSSIHAKETDLGNEYKYIPQIWMLPFTQCWLSSTVLQLHMVSTQQLVYCNFSIFRAHQIFPVGHVFFFFYYYSDTSWLYGELRVVWATNVNPLRFHWAWNWKYIKIIKYVVAVELCRETKR